MRQYRLYILLWVALGLLAGCSEDTNPPRIIAKLPAAYPDSNSLSVPRGTNSFLIGVQFNEELRASSIPSDIIWFEHEGQTIPGKMSFLSSVNSIIFVPEAKYKHLFYFLRGYEVGLGSGISDKDGNRTKTGENWSFWIADGTFDRTELVEIDDRTDAENPKVAMGPNGQGFLYWEQSSSNGRMNIWARAFGHLVDANDPGIISENVLASSAFPVEDNPSVPADEDPDVGDARSPHIAIDGAGDAIAVWSQFDGTDFRIYTNQFDGIWTRDPEPAPISDSGSDATLPQVAIAPDGSAIAVWEQADRIQASRFSNDSWSAPAPLDDGNGTASTPQIAFDSSGNGIAVWSQGNQVYASHYSSGVWTRFSIGNGAGTTGSPQLALDYDGDEVTDAVVVWTQSDGTRDNIWANRYNDGAWLTAELLETGTGNAQTPRVSMNRSGTAIAVWAQPSSSAPARYRIRSSRLAGGNWEATSEPIDSFPSQVYAPQVADKGISTDPQIAIDSDGNAFAVWTLQWTLKVDGENQNFKRTSIARYRGPKAHEALRGWTNASIFEVDDPGFFGDGISPHIALHPTDLTGRVVWTKANNNIVDPDDENQRRFSIQSSNFR